MTRPPSSGLFRGSELPRLLVLVAIVALGWPLALFYAGRPAPPKPQPEPIAAAKPPPPPDNAPAFAGIKDKAPMSFNESAAYGTLLTRARETPSDQLDAQASRTVHFGELLERPARYRGVPIHVEGTARRVIVHHEINPLLAPRGRLYEAFVFNHDSQNFPYILIFEDAPQGMPGGLEINQRVVFNGYFFKLLAYQAADTARFAPLLVGRLQWRPYKDSDEENPGHGTRLWTMIGLGAVTLYTLGRWLWLLRRRALESQGKGRSRSTLARPTETIEPDALSEWLDEETPADEDDPYGLHKHEDEDEDGR